MDGPGTCCPFSRTFPWFLSADRPYHPLRQTSKPRPGSESSVLLQLPLPAKSRLQVALYVPRPSAATLTPARRTPHHHRRLRHRLAHRRPRLRRGLPPGQRVRKSTRPRRRGAGGAAGARHRQGRRARPSCRRPSRSSPTCRRRPRRPRSRTWSASWSGSRSCSTPTTPRRAAASTCRARSCVRGSRIEDEVRATEEARERAKSKSWTPPKMYK